MNRELETTRSVHIRMELLKNGSVVDMLEGTSYQGSVNGNAKSSVRRTADFSIVLQDYNNFLPEEKGKIWLNSEIVISVGLEDAARTGDIQWFPLGTFVFLKFNLSRTHQGATMSCSVSDKMVLLDGTLRGTLDLKTVLLPQGLTIDTAFSQTLQQLSHINQNNIIIQDIKVPLPYEISAAPGETVASLFETLLNLYMGFEMFWDGEYFIVRRIRKADNDPYVWDFTKDSHGLTIVNNNGVDFTNIRNKAVVYGKVSKNGVQLKTVYHNKYLRRYLNRKVYATHEEIDIPFIFDQQLGDIVHIADPIQIQEIIGDCDFSWPEKPEEKGLQFPDYVNRWDGLVAWRKNRYARNFLSQPRSYIWTNTYTAKQFFVGNDANHPNYNGINTGPDALIRLDYYPELEYPIIVKSLRLPDAVLTLEADYSKRCTEEPATRFYQVKRVDPEPVNSEVAVVVAGTNNQHFTLSQEIWDTINAEVYVNGKVAAGVTKTNREHKGYIIFAEPVPSSAKVVVNYLARNPGTKFVNEDIYVEHTYRLKQSSWIELDFNVVPGFRSEILGESVVEYSSQDIFNKTQADLRAEYELFQHSHLAEEIKCDCVPIYSLKEITKVRIQDDKIGINGDYLIDTINIPLDAKSAMSFNAHKIQVPFNVEPILRTRPQGMFRSCTPSQIFFPAYADKYYKYDFDRDVFGIQTRLLNEEVVPLSAEERTRIVVYVRKVLEDEAIDLGSFLNRVKMMINFVAFTNSFDKNRFINLFTKTKATMKKMMETLPLLETSSAEEQQITSERCHFVSDNDGRILVDYELGNGNTFEKLEMFLPEDPPGAFKTIDSVPAGVNACEYKYDHWPLNKPGLPPRPRQQTAVVQTQNSATQGFVRRRALMGFPFKFWDYEPTVYSKITSHFCSTTKIDYAKIAAIGNVEMKEPEKVFISKHTLWVGAISNPRVPLFISLGLGNTRDSLRVEYRGKYWLPNQRPIRLLKKQFSLIGSQLKTNIQ